MPKAHVLFFASVATLFTACRSPREGSAGVFILRQDSIVVATDSKVTGLSKKDVRPKTCKMAISDTEMVIANAAILNDGSGNFLDAGKKITKGKTDVVKVAKEFDGIIVPRLTNLMAKLKVENPTYFTERLNTAVYSIAFAILLPAGPEVATRSYELIPSSGAPSGFEIQIRPNQCLTSCNGAVITIGRDDEMVQFLEAHPEHIQWEPIELSKKLIGIAISSHPDVVGPPIAVVQVHGGDITWIDHGKCK